MGVSVIHKQKLSFEERIKMTPLKIINAIKNLNDEEMFTLELLCDKEETEFLMKSLEAANKGEVVSIDEL